MELNELVIWTKDVKLLVEKVKIAHSTAMGYRTKFLRTDPDTNEPCCLFLAGVQDTKSRSGRLPKFESNARGLSLLGVHKKKRYFLTLKEKPAPCRLMQP